MDHCCAEAADHGVGQTLQEMDFERGIWSAAQYGDLQRLKELFTSPYMETDKRDSAGYTALHYAARNGHLEVCKFLVGRCADINSITRGMQATPLHRASASGKQEVVQYLLDKNAEILLRDADGKTALHRAAERHQLEICKMLVERAPILKSCLDLRNKAPSDYWYIDVLI